MHEHRERTRIAVLGAGYGGLSAFLELEDRLHRREFDLVLVNATPFHYFVTRLHTLAAGVEEEEWLRIPLRRVVRPPGRLLVGRIEALVPAERAVLMADQPPFMYDYCIVGLGSDPEYFQIPGAAEFGLVVGSPQAARRVRDRLSTTLADSVNSRASVVIAGGGLTGVELAGEFADAYPGMLDITLVEAAPRLMAGFDDILTDAAARMLLEKGIVIRTGAPIRSVDASWIQLADGVQLPYDVFVWAGGVRGNAILGRSNLELTPRGRAWVDPYLRVPGVDSIYVVGDAASVVDPSTGLEVPPSAQAAVQMGRHAAKNLLLRLQGQPEEPFLPRLRGVLASLGRHAAIGSIGQERLVGLPAILAKRLIEAHHVYEAGGVLPILQRLLRPATRLLDGRAHIRRGQMQTPLVPKPRPGLE